MPAARFRHFRPAGVHLRLHILVPNCAGGEAVTSFRTPSNAMADCIESCMACEHLCVETLAWCRARGGADPKLPALLALTADICAASARAMAGGSDAYVYLCHACAQVCQRCAESCGALAEEAQLRACAETARWPEPALEAGKRRAS